MNVKRSILLRVRVAFLAASLFAVAILLRIGHIQIADGEKWSAMAEEIDLQYRQVKATRGSIYSDNGSLMATSLPFYRVAFDPSVVEGNVFEEGLDSLSHLLADYFGDRSSQYYKRKLLKARDSKRRYVVINNKRVNYHDKKDMQGWPIFRKGRLKGGAIFEKVDLRFKPFSHLGTRTIGFINENSNGAGLEYSFNHVLAGTDGKALFQKMAGGGWKPLYDGSEVKAVEGMDIETTIDINLQDVAESALLRALKQHDANYGCVVVMEVETGHIKAISNLSKNKQGNYWELYNYAVGQQGLTEPGSTFKLASMIALLEDSQIALMDTIATGTGTFEYYDKKMRDHKRGGYGTITVAEAFSKSSNIGISRLVNQHFGLKPKKFTQYLQQMGLTEPLDFQMKGAGTPYIKSPGDPTWSGVTLPWMSIGYELKLTPLHTLAFYNAVANNGTMVRPLIVKRISKAGTVQDEFRPQVIKESICSPQTLQQVQKLLEKVVQTGTASNIKNADYGIAGKTGTAQKVKAGGGYEKAYYTSFAGYFPADQPKYSCIVIIDKPKGYNQYGSDVAAPVFKEIADNIYSRDADMHKLFTESINREIGVFPVIKSGNLTDLQLICNELGVSNHTSTDAEWVLSKRNYNSVKWVENDVSSLKVPNVLGMTLRDALPILENHGIQVNYSGKGRIIKQSMQYGSNITPGAKINLVLG
ncbi:MAG: transpeptidase family protein [Cyclobacteriaceae bacterium]|nr:transpeptidase family protein [Cyclobacteriaceae bacterium]